MNETDEKYPLERFPHGSSVLTDGRCVFCGEPGPWSDFCRERRLQVIDAEARVGRTSWLPTYDDEGLTPIETEPLLGTSRDLAREVGLTCEEAARRIARGNVISGRELRKMMERVVQFISGARR